MKTRQVQAHPSVLLLLRVAATQAGPIDSAAAVRQACRAQDALFKVLPPGCPDYVHPVLLGRMSAGERAKVDQEAVRPDSERVTARLFPDDFAWLGRALEAFQKHAPPHFAPVFVDALDAMERSIEVPVG